MVSIREYLFSRAGGGGGGGPVIFLEAAPASWGGGGGGGGVWTVHFMLGVASKFDG